jgi:signal transduction histidine kinase
MLTTSGPPRRAPSGPDREHIDRTIVVLATAAAWLFFVILTTSWLVSGDTSLLVQAAAPVTVGGVGVFMLALGRPRPLVQVGIGTAGLIVFVSASESAVPGNPLVGLLIMAIVGSALADHRVIAISIVSAIALASTGFAWHPPGTPANDRAVMAFSLVVAFVFVTWLLHYLKSQAMKDRDRLEDLLCSKDEFLATVSHELRTPLTSVVGLAHELDERWGDFSGAEIAEFTSLLVSQSADITNIVDDLLVAASADQGDITLHRSVVDLHREIKGIVCEPLDVRLDDPQTGTLFVVADPLRLRQIVRNLVSNALRYGGGTVRVVTASDGATASVEVRDDGPPLSNGERDRIFDAYYRAGRVEGRPGSVGLGLTVSRRLARLMGGDLVYNHDGSEAAFTLTLPQVSRPARTSAAEAATV